MRAMVLDRPGGRLELRQLEPPSPTAHQALVRVECCAVCRTDLHIVDDELVEAGIGPPAFPLVLGHQVVGTVVENGEGVSELEVGSRVGIPWLGETCGSCRFCRTERENLCSKARFTGYHINGGFAELATADSRYCFPIPDRFSDLQAAPLLCAGLIGYRTLRMAGDAERVGIYGFGAAAHILAQILRHQERPFYAFTRPGDERAQDFARRLGARWAGGSDEEPPEELDAALLFAPVGGLVPKGLRDVRKGGVVVSGGIHMSDIPSFPYHLLWGERSLRSVANLTRRDGVELLKLASEIPIRTEVTTYPLAEAGRALDDLRAGRLEGAAVLLCQDRA